MSDDWPMHYILVNRLPVAVDLWTWARWLEKNHKVRRIGDDWVGAVRVSTVFIGLDHSFGRGDPLVFETMVFGGPLNMAMDRYATYAEAERGHQEMLTKVKIASAQIKAIADTAGAKS